MQIVHSLFGSHLGKVASRGENVNEDSYTHRGGGGAGLEARTGSAYVKDTAQRDAVRKMGFLGISMTEPQD